MARGQKHDLILPSDTHTLLKGDPVAKTQSAGTCEAQMLLVLTQKVRFCVIFESMQKATRCMRVERTSALLSAVRSRALLATHDTIFVSTRPWGAVITHDVCVCTLSALAGAPHSCASCVTSLSTDVPISRYIPVL